MSRGPLRDTPSPKVARRIKRLAELPAAEQRAVLKVVDGFLDSFTPTTPRCRAATRQTQGQLTISS